MDTQFLTDLNDLFHFRDTTSQYNETVCVSKIDHFRFYQFAIIPAVLISIAFSALKQRRRKLLDVLYGRPALVHPMDALTSSASTSYVAAFGATIFLVYEVIFHQQFAFRYEGRLELKTLVVIVSMVWYGFVYFPVFATLSIRSIFSYAVGSLYVWIITAIFFYKAFECNVSWQARLIALARDLPNLACLAYLSVSFLVKFVLALRKKTYFVFEETDLDKPQTLRYIRGTYQGLHVRKLLRRPEPKPDPPDTIKGKIKTTLIELVHSVLYKNEKGFKYSTRIQSVLMVGVFLLYIVTFEFMSNVVVMFDGIIDKLGTTLISQNITPTEHIQFVFSDTNTWIVLLYHLFTNGKICWIVSMVMALIIGLVMILHMLSSYRTNLLALYRGDHSHIPDKKERSNASLMVGCMRFAGYQVGYIAWGYVIHIIIFFLLSMTISVIVLLTQSGIINNWLLEKVLQLWPILAWTIVLNILQLLLAKFLFLQERGDTLSIDNRRFFFIFTYFMFFFNIFLGLVSCLLRILKAIVLGALFLPRLDHSTLSQRFQFFDPGFAAYVGYMHVENEHTNPVMIVFIRLMLMNLHFRRLGKITSVDLNGSMRYNKDKRTSVRCINLEFRSDGETRPSPEAKRRKYKAGFNWLLFYTLINNPQIRVYRKGYIQIMMRAVEHGLSIPVSDLPTADLSKIGLSFKQSEDAKKENQNGGFEGSAESSRTVKDTLV